MDWKKIKDKHKDPINDMCKYLADWYSKKHKVYKVNVEFHFDGRDIKIFAGRYIDNIQHEDILKYFDEKWNIYINVQTDVMRGVVCRSYSVSWLEDNVFYNSDLFGGHRDFKAAFYRAYCKCFKLVGRFMKEEEKRKEAMSKS